MGTSLCYKVKKEGIASKLDNESCEPYSQNEEMKLKKNSINSPMPDHVQQMLRQQADIEEEVEEIEESDQEVQQPYIAREIIQEGTDVFSALNIQNGQLLALKLFRFNDEDTIEMVSERVYQLQQLDHNNIHKIMGWDNYFENDVCQENQILILMPYESGGSISWLLQKFSKFSPHLAAIFMKQILEGLNYLHSNNIYHQNLKTSNVLVDGDANIKLSDINVLNSFKLSFYSAPECFEFHQYTAAADVWSAGCIFMEMLTKQNPWTLETPSITLQEIKEYFNQKSIHNPYKSILEMFQYKKIIKDQNILDILDRIFKYRSEDRLTPAELLNLPFFKDLESDQIKSVLITNRITINQPKPFKSYKSQFSNSSMKSQQNNQSKLSSISVGKNSEQQQKLSKIIYQINSTEIGWNQTGGIAADGTHKSLSHFDIQNVVSQKIQIENSCRYREQKHKKQNRSESLNNKLIADGFIRQQTQSQQINNNDITQQLTGYPQIGQKPPLNNNQSQYKSIQSKLSNSMLNSSLKQYQTERSKYLQSLDYNQSDGVDEQSQQKQTLNDVDLLENLMAQQFYQEEQQQQQVSSQNQQQLEDLMMQQFQSITKPQDEDYFEQLMQQQFQDSSENDEKNSQQEVQQLEDMMALQFYQFDDNTNNLIQDNQKNIQNNTNNNNKNNNNNNKNININTDNNNDIQNNIIPSSPIMIESRINDEPQSIIIKSVEPSAIIQFDKLVSEEKPLEMKEVPFLEVEQFHLMAEDIEGDFILMI